MEFKNYIKIAFAILAVTVIWITLDESLLDACFINRNPKKNKDLNFPRDAKSVFQVDPNPIVSKENHNDKWIVVTTINKPTPTIQMLASLSEWNVVVIGDLKTPSDWHYPNCTYLDVDAQLQLGYQTTKLLPFNAYSRKNIGYLYAIQHGAKTIYETDDDNELLIAKIIQFPNEFEVLMYNAQPLDRTNFDIVNPYAYFGEPSIWPRGYPLTEIGRKNNFTFTKQKKQVSIQQYLANGDPDVDAVYRLTQKTHGEKIDIKFQDNDPFALPHGTFCPYNSQNTLHHYNALWALLIPISTTFRVCDIWRSYWAQRVLWEIDSHLMFGAPSVYQDRNEHNYLDDFLDEDALYADAGRLASHLMLWKSTKPHLFDRIMDCIASMIDHDFMGPSDAFLTEAWLSDLHSFGYIPPKPI